MVLEKIRLRRRDSYISFYSLVRCVPSVTGALRFTERDVTRIVFRLLSAPDVESSFDLVAFQERECYVFLRQQSAATRTTMTFGLGIDFVPQRRQLIHFDPSTLLTERYPSDCEAKDNARDEL